MERLERIKELQFDYIDNDGVNHKIIYQSAPELLRQGICELFVSFYDEFRRKYLRRKHV